MKFTLLRTVLNLCIDQPDLKRYPIPGYRFLLLDLKVRRAGLSRIGMQSIESEIPSLENDKEVTERPLREVHWICLIAAQAVRFPRLYWLQLNYSITFVPQSGSRLER